MSNVKGEQLKNDILPFAIKKNISIEYRKQTQNVPRMMVARPRAVPIPLPLIAFGPTRLNL
jgi:hypothetical protein